MKVADIKIGERIRQELGNIDSLADSIQRVGLLHPVVVTEDGRLISGARRIVACIKLGWDDVPITTAHTLKEAVDLLQAERDENTERKPLEIKEVFALRKLLEPLEKEAAERRRSQAPGQSQGTKKVSSGKLPEETKGEALEKVAEAVGISRSTLEHITKVEEAAEAEPDKFAAIAEEMHQTGKVDPAYRKMKKVKAKDAKGAAKPGSKGRRTRPCADPGKEVSKLTSTILKLVTSWQSNKFSEILDDLSTPAKKDLANNLKKLVRALRKSIKELEE